MVSSLEPSFAYLLSQAETLAARRQEPLRGVHLLAAVGAVPGSVRDVLEEHRAGFRRVLNGWEGQSKVGLPENFHLFRARVREVARTFGSRSPDAIHLLLALLDDTRGSARQVLDFLGVDLGALRLRATQLGQGLPSADRARRPSPTPSRDMIPPRGSSPRGEVVPVMPPLPVVAPRVARNVGPIAAAVGPAAQALSMIPQVGPTPLPQQRLRGRPYESLTPLPGEGREDPKPTFAAERAGERVLEGPDALLETEESPSELSRALSPSASSASASSARALSEEEKRLLHEQYGLPKKLFPILSQLGRNLSLAAALGEADDVVGRDDEIEAALDILAKRQGNNPCLIGAAGVGKTSIARGVATAILENPEDDRLVIEIPISELVAGTGMRGALAGRLGAIKKEVQLASGRVILFFDDVHQLFTGDAAEEIASDLKLSLARGELPCIGATSTEEYRRVIESDATLSRRFSAIEIEEPQYEDAFLILSSLAPRLSSHHGVQYNEDAIARAISWSLRYLPGRCLPDKAVGILDLAGARARRRGGPVVDAEAVAQVVASQSNMPVERLLESDGERMLQLREILCERVIGHEIHLEKIARILRRNAAGLGTRRPIGTFLLLGPTGVGKTETAKAVAEALFHTESAMTRIDMAEMSEAHAVAKLVGAPPGYIGHDAGGMLTEAVRRRPYQVVLLDEIEKAHPEVLTAFLAVFDEGRMTDSRGRLVDFTNTVLILTSNIGSEITSGSMRKRVGFGNENACAEDRASLVIDAAKRALAPELYNRIDEVLAFSPLTRPDVKRIGKKLCAGLTDELELSRGISLDIHESAIDYLLDEGGHEPELGARPLRRMISRLIEAPLAEAILGGQLRAGDTWKVEAVEGELQFSVFNSRATAAAE